MPQGPWPVRCVRGPGVISSCAFGYMRGRARAELMKEGGRAFTPRLSQRLFEKVMNIPLANRQGTTGTFAKRISEYEHVRDFFTSTTVVLVVDMLFVFLFLGLIILLGGFLVVLPLAGIIVAVITGLSLQKL